jgi:capsular polysaccharide export protein
MEMSNIEFAPDGGRGLPAIRRHFLFLQGLPGPSMRKLASALRRRGHRTSRINFNGGDLWDWRATGAHNYRGNHREFAPWLDAFMLAMQCTDIILFGDSRVYHRVAIDRAARSGVKIYVLEEGMLRPNFVSLEMGGTNDASSLPRNMDGLRSIAALAAGPFTVTDVRSSVLQRTLQAAGYYLAQILARPFFPQYLSHRCNPPMRELRAWTARYIGRHKEAARSRTEMNRLGDQPFFLFPMQIDGDSQIMRHSDFADISGALDCVLHSFSVHAPAGLNLVIKMHPFDPDVLGWRAIVARKARQYGVTGQVYFVERYDLAPLLNAAKGVVTVNSTVGPLALAADVPVFCLGRAVYDIEGITAQCGFDEFWRNPPHVNAENFEIFCKALSVSALINGGFHDKLALEMLVQGAADRIEADPFATLSLAA